MIVTMNGNPFDVTLERERTLGELLTGIESWLERSRFSVSALSLNGEAIAASQIEGACAMDLDEVETLDIRASSWNELLIEALTESDRVLMEAQKDRRDAVVEGRPSRAAEIAASFEATAASGFMAGNGKDLYIRIADILNRGNADDDGRIEAVRSEIADRIRELNAPVAELSRLGARMDDLASKLEEVPLELQTGKDAQAARTLGDFAALMGSLLRLVPLAENESVGLSERTLDGVTFPDFINDLRTALSELTAGYENGDAILVGDLAEYEIAPRLKTLAGLLAETVGRGA